MKKNYIYRMDHDTGFAPHISETFCSMTGCKCSKTGKRKNIEEAAEEGSWIIGIGGLDTKQPDKIIYVMEVLDNISRNQFRKDHPHESEYIKPTDGGTRVLISSEFYYFGDKAITLPDELKHIIVSTQGCKIVTDEDIEKLKSFLIKENWTPGKHGEPNNPDYSKKKKAKFC